MEYQWSYKQKISWFTSVGLFWASTLFLYPVFGKLQELSRFRPITELIYANKITNSSSSFVYLFYFLFSFLQIIAYFLLIQKIFHIEKKTSPCSTKQKKILILILPVIIGSTVSPVFSSTDIYYYLGVGRLQALYGKNPYITPIASVSSEIINQIGDWVVIPTMYPPLLVYFFKVLAQLSFGNIVLHLFLYKTVVLLFYLTSAWLIYKIVRLVDMNLSFLSAVAFLANPLLLHEILVNGHNDIFALSFLLMGLYAVLLKRNKNAMMLFFLSVMLKFTVLILSPLLFFYMLRNSASLARLLKDSILSGLLSLVFLGLFYFLYFQDTKAVKAFSIILAYWGPSSPATLALLLKKYFLVSNKHLIQLAKFIKLSFVFFCFYRAWKIYSPKDLLREIAIVTYLFLLLFSSYVQPWYWVNFLAFMFFLFPKHLGHNLIVGCLLSLGALSFWVLYLMDPFPGDLFPSFTLQYLAYLAPLLIASLYFYFRNRQEAVQQLP